MSQIFIAPDYSCFQVKSAIWIMRRWKCINFIWPFTNGGYQYLYSGCCCNKLVIGMKTSVKLSCQHSKCTFMHTFFCEIKAEFLTFCTVIVKKKKGSHATIKGQPSATSKHSFLGSFRWTCANMSALLVATAISFYCISHSFVLKGNSNFIHSCVPQLCYYRI